MGMTLPQKIHNLQWGHVDIHTLTAEEIEQIIDYSVPVSVMALCLAEIDRRRDMRLEQSRKAEKI